MIVITAYIILVFLSPFVFALTQRDLFRSLKNPGNGEYQTGWHNYQWITMLLVCSLGYIMNYIPWYYYPAEAFILWTLSDGIQNWYKNEKFWTVNVLSKDPFMPYSGWYVKVPLIIAGAVLIIVFEVFIK